MRALHQAIRPLYNGEKRRVSSKDPQLLNDFLPQFICIYILKPKRICSLILPRKSLTLVAEADYFRSYDWIVCHGPTKIWSYLFLSFVGLEVFIQHFIQSSFCSPSYLFSFFFFHVCCSLFYYLWFGVPSFFYHVCPLNFFAHLSCWLFILLSLTTFHLFRIQNYV